MNFYQLIQITASIQILSEIMSLLTTSTLPTIIYASTLTTSLTSQGTTSSKSVVFNSDTSMTQDPTTTTGFYSDLKVLTDSSSLNLIASTSSSGNHSTTFTESTSSNGSGLNIYGDELNWKLKFTLPLLLLLPCLL